MLLGARDLPRLSGCAQRLIEILNSPQPVVADVAEVLARPDAGDLSSPVLRLANSSPYGLRTRVTSLSHAVALLGFRTTRSAVLAAAIAELFRTPPRSPCMNMPAFALHGMASAVVARRLSRYAGIGDPEVSYTLGLVHDLGKLVLDQCYPDDYLRAVTFARRSPQPSWKSERAVLAYDHAAVGNAIAHIYKLPDDVAAAVGRHHDPKAPLESDLSLVEHVAAHVCWVKNYRCHDEYVPPELNDTAWRRLHLDARAMEHLLGALDVEVQSACEMFLPDRPAVV